MEEKNQYNKIVDHTSLLKSSMDFFAKKSMKHFEIKILPISRDKT